MGRTPKARHGFGSYFAPQPPLWPDPVLVRDDEKASAVADLLGAARAIVLRGNGCVVTGASVEEAVAMTYFLESAATVELAVIQAADPSVDIELTADEAAARAVTSGGIVERSWAYLTHGDPEA